MHCPPRSRKTLLAVSLAALTVPASVLLSSCGGSASSAATSTNATATNPYAIAYQAAKYNNGSGGSVTVSFPTACTMKISSTGAAYAHDTYYLTPVSPGQTAVVTTGSGIQLSVSPYANSGLSNTKAISATFNTCPTKASSTTTAGMGAIGFIFAGNTLFNPYEATGTVALGDNVNYTFTQGGATYTAGFLDSCNGHSNNTGTWHFHANPTCWTSVVDGASGASHIIGIALDGFPIYGGRDINGNVVDVTTLDACNGITSATPEFPSGAYHYVLPLDSTGKAIKTKQSSLTCYAGTVNATIASQMKKLGCTMPLLLANGKLRLPDGREVTRDEAMVWMRDNMSNMPGMQMAALPDAAAVGRKAERVPPQKHSMMNMAGM